MHPQAVLALLLFSNPAWAADPPASASLSRPSPAAAMQEPVPGDAALALAAEFKSAYSAWRSELRAARKQSKELEAEVEARDPLLSFGPRFETLAQAGSGRALLWLAAYADERLDSRPAAELKKRELYELLAAKYLAEDWIDELVAQLASERSWLERPVLEQLYARIESQNPSKQVKAAALMGLVRLLDTKQATEPERLRVAALKQRLKAEFADTREGAELLSQEFAEKHLQVGMTVPDFETTDADGVAFKLSDYRGKVVLLDFWGFW